LHKQGSPSANHNQNIVTTVFWPGELPTATDPGNLQSAFDPYWLENAPHEPPFFFALPYVDIEAGHTKSEASTVIPWFKTAFVRDGKSVLEGRWIEIHKDGRVAYATWGDVGSAHTDDGSMSLATSLLAHPITEQHLMFHLKFSATSKCLRKMCVAGDFVKSEKYLQDRGYHLTIN
jgi:hypothetical protein